MRIVEKFRIVIASAVAILLCSFASFADLQPLPDGVDVEFIPTSDYAPSRLRLYARDVEGTVTKSNSQYWTRLTSGNYYPGSIVNPMVFTGTAPFSDLSLLTEVPADKYVAVRWHFGSSYFDVNTLTDISGNVLSGDALGFPTKDIVYYVIEDPQTIIFYSSKPIQAPYNTTQLIFCNGQSYEYTRYSVTIQYMLSDESFLPPSFDDQLLGKLDDIINQFQGLVDQLRDLRDALKASLDWMAYNVTNNVAGLSVGSTHTIDEETYTYPSYTEYSFSLADEHVQFHPQDKSGTFLGIIHRKFNELMELFRFEFELFFQWYYPLKDSVPQYWQVFNTDTNDYTMVNPAGVTAYITWYLGKLYQHLDADIDSILEEPVNQTKQAIVQLENAENSIKNEVIPSISGWVPDSSSFGSLSAIGYIGNYLQRVFVALSQYNVVIMIGLVLGICMQFIGFFKYK